MPNTDESTVFELIYVIVDCGQGSKVIHIAKKLGISGGAIYYGKGTANIRFQELLGFYNIRKEIVLMVASLQNSTTVLDTLEKKFHFERPNHGIAFTISICNVVGSRCNICDCEISNSGRSTSMYKSITVIVDKGMSEFVIEAATKAGSKGATIINARGSGIHETKKLFSMEIEPEKEIVMILSDCEKADSIVNSIQKQIRIDEPGNGILYIQDVNKIYGLKE